MEVVMGERIDFSARLPDDHEPQLDRVVCRNGVRLESYIYEGAKLIGLTRATLAEFTLDHTRGTFEGLGPGHIDNWRYGRTRRIAIEPGATKQTRDPDPSNKLPWEYARISFAGMIDGNINHQTAVLHDWVQILYAPVAQPLQQFERDQLSSNSESASKAAWLGCDQLRVAMREQTDSDDSYVQLLGWGNAELEGQLFRALAHEVSFDESKELFTLRGRGDNKAVLYYQERPGPARVGHRLRRSSSSPREAGSSWTGRPASRAWNDRRPDRCRSDRPIKKGPRCHGPQCMPADTYVATGAGFSTAGSRQLNRRSIAARDRFDSS